MNIILDDLRFGYTDTQLAKFVTYWKEYEKHSTNTIEITKQIAKDFRMSVDNTFLVILHLKRKGLI
jgi:hypothetical protein